MRLAEIAQRLDCTVEGDGNIDISGVAGIDHAAAGQLTFLSNPRYRKLVASTRASAILVGRDAGPLPTMTRDGAPSPMAGQEADARAVPLAALRSANPYLDFARALEIFHQPTRYAPGIHATAVVAATARLGAGAHVGPFCFVDEGVEIGHNAVLHSFVSVYRGARIGDDFFAHSHVVVREGCHIGNRVLLQNGAVVGSDGFGFARRDDGSWHKIVQTGPAVIEDDVEIQANACIDRATVGETRIRRGAKIDNLVQVGHASHVGEDTLLCAQVGLAGTTKVGNKCILAGQVGAGGHLSIGDGANIVAQSGLHNDLPAGGTYSGSPAIDFKQWRRCVAAFAKLPELMKTVRELEARVGRGEKA
jgi:UDP-3-O-[3-hydroxymyristoyl] glucosamine N-acyltransferase